MSHSKFIFHLTIGLVLVPLLACVAEDLDEDPLRVRAAPTAPPNSWIVVFEAGVSVDSRVPEIAAAHGVAVEHTYRHALRGFNFHGSTQGRESCA